MGISLQMYRSCIGRFNIILKAKHFNKRSSIDQVSSLRMKPYLLVFLVLSVSFSTAAYRAYNEPLTSQKVFKLHRPLAHKVRPQFQSKLYSKMNPTGQILTHSVFTRRINTSPLINLNSNPHSTHQWLTKKDRNHLAKIISGNRR